MALAYPEPALDVRSRCAQGCVIILSVRRWPCRCGCSPLSLHLFAHIFTNPHCPRASLPSPVPHPSPRTCSEPGSPLCFGSHSPKLAAFSRAPSRSFVSRSGALSLGQWDSFHSFYQDCRTSVLSRHANASPLLLTLLRGPFCALRDENHCCQNHHQLRFVRPCKLPAVPAQVLLVVLGRATLFLAGSSFRPGAFAWPWAFSFPIWPCKVCCFVGLSNITFCHLLHIPGFSPLFSQASVLFSLACLRVSPDPHKSPAQC